MSPQQPSPTSTSPLVIGSLNRKKAAELAGLLEPWQVAWQSLADFPNPLEVDETGNSFAENAALKATQQAIHLQRWVLGDDSGLVVDALNGAPGIYSARYAGVGATDQQNCDRLLAEMENVPTERRTAHFVCHLVLADPSGRVRAESAGRCQGRIRREESGSGGFGYDPMFEIVEYHRTFGELHPAVKSCLSHRARAMRAMLPRVVELIDTGEWCPRG